MYCKCESLNKIQPEHMDLLLSEVRRKWQKKVDFGDTLTNIRT